MGNQQLDNQWQQGTGGPADTGGRDSSILQSTGLQGHPGDPGSAGWHQ